MMLRQEAALDRSIDRKVSILLRLRKELTNSPVAPPAGQDDGARMGDTEKVLDSDIIPETPQSAEAVEDSKTTEQCGNIIENKGSRFENQEQSRNPIQNKGSYTLIAGMLLKREEIGCGR
jgi:hypothetical protein